MLKLIIKVDKVEGYVFNKLMVAYRFAKTQMTPKRKFYLYSNYISDKNNGTTNGVE